MARKDLKAASHQPLTSAKRVGCVSYLNAKPLIAGIESDASNIFVRFDVPSQLRQDLATGEADLALCPVFDYFAAASAEDPTDRLMLVPVGGIGCEGPTLTVRLFSQVPLADLTTVYADTDSHTSAALVRVLLAELFQVRPTMIDYHARENVAEGKLAERPEAMLLIGDKVVTDAPPAVPYAYQLDLGEAWHELTGLPFVFAMWMARRDSALGDLPLRLAERLSANLPQRSLIAERYAAEHGWPADLADHYLTDVLTYEISTRSLEAVQRFGDYLFKHGLIRAKPGPIELWPTTGGR